MRNVIPALLLIPLFITLYSLAAPAALLCSILLLLFFELRKTKEVLSVLFTAFVFFLGLLIRACYLIFLSHHSFSFTALLHSLLTCSLTLTAFILIKFTLFIYKESR